MKHNWKVTAILLSMFVITQVIGLFVTAAYANPVVIGNETVNLVPFGMEPPAVEAAPALGSIVFSFVIAILLIFLLMKFKAAIVLRTWFFIVVILAIGIVLNIILVSVNPDWGLREINLGILTPTIAEFVSVIVALPLAFFKVFKREIFTHNLTELLVYPGIAVVFIPILNVWTAIALLILISAYDMYAVWHSGFMQKMAKYQISHLKFFAGFFVPYMSKGDRVKLQKIKSAKKSKKDKEKALGKLSVNLAILGGGDVVFPIITAGVVMAAGGLAAAISVVVGATLALALLFYYSEKGKFYPAMPFITGGILVGLGFAYLVF